MKKLLITFDDGTATVLAKSPNMSETVRQAMMIYNEHISTDTLSRMRMSFENIKETMLAVQSEVKDMRQSFDAMYELIEAQGFKPKEADPWAEELPCCKEPKPCKHWIWDGTISAYVNSITGKKREAL